MGTNQAKKANSEPHERGKALIFVVDDEPMLLELATVVLQPLGYQIKSFRDPDAALKAFRNCHRQPELLITDYAMHTMTGMDLIMACRRIQPEQKILLLSGTVDEKIYRDSASKPDGFLPKPYQAKQLVEAVRALVPAEN